MTHPAPDVLLAAEIGVLAPSVAAGSPELRKMLRRGLWTRHGSVVVQHNGPLTSEQALWVAVLRAPAGAVLAGATAAVQRGLRWAEPEVPRLLVPAAGPLPHLTGVLARRTRVLGDADVHPTAQPPQLRLGRAVIDEATLARRSDDVRALLCAPVQQRRLRAKDLREVVLRLGPVRHRKLMLVTLDDVDGGAHSVRELQFTRELRRARLPMPTRQVVRRRAGGRYYLDAVWDDYALHVEVDGLGHLLVLAWGQDCDRSNELELGKGGERRLRIPGFWLDEKPGHAMDQVRRGLVLGGWTASLPVDVAINRAS
jgi:hypothetical protein